MSIKVGIVGLPNVGKSTLFNAISQNVKAQASNYRFCTIDPNIGLIDVPDERLNRLAQLVKPQKIVPTQIEIADIAGLVKGASKGEGLGNKFLSNIREVNAIIHVVRCFADDNVIRDEGPINPLNDIEIIETELQLKDLESIEKKLSRLEKLVKLSSDTKSKLELATLQLCQDLIGRGVSLRNHPFSLEELHCISDLYLLTLKPVLYLANVSENDMLTGNVYSKIIAEKSKAENTTCLVLCNQLEAQIAELENPEDKDLFLAEYKLSEPGLNKLILEAYKLLSLDSFFTVGPQEVRAWTVLKGSKAPEAAGVIHSDFEKGFIKAETISFEDFIKYGSELACRENGRIRIEGKDYVVKDGDIFHFRFNV